MGLLTMAQTMGLCVLMVSPWFKRTPRGQPSLVQDAQWNPLFASKQCCFLLPGFFFISRANQNIASQLRSDSHATTAQWIQPFNPLWLPRNMGAHSNSFLMCALTKDIGFGWENSYRFAGERVSVLCRPSALRHGLSLD